MSEEKTPIIKATRFERATEIVKKAAETLYPENDPRSVEARQVFMNQQFHEALIQATMDEGLALMAEQQARGVA